jgi:pilus assembly protein Flp/PilA
MSATFHLGRGNPFMLKYYVIVAACIVAAVAAAFGTGTSSGIGLALTSAIGKISTSVNTAVTG